ncbi:MAG TPA: SH3 domain-containing protein [Caldilineaceae bacterium]|nr:SH3 domain-containing protein [Caldilineaceae bacterium]
MMAAAKAQDPADRAKAPARLLAISDADASVIRFVLHFAAPADDEAPLLAPARLEVSDGRELELGMLSGPTAETWTSARELEVATLDAPGGQALAATLVWGVRQIVSESYPPRGEPGEDQAQRRPTVTLLRARSLNEQLALAVELEVEALGAEQRVRVDGGAGNVHWLAPAGQDAGRKLELTFCYTKPGPYTLSVDLLDQDGYWVETLHAQTFELSSLAGDPSPATAAGEPSAPAVALEEVGEPSASTPWLPFRYARPLWAWARTYTRAGGTVVSRYLALGTYLAVRQEVMAGGQLWYQTGSYDWIPASSVAFLTPSELRGVQLNGDRPDPEPEPEPEPGPTRKGVVTANALNVRSGPGVQNPVVDHLRYGAQVTIYEEAVVSGATWYRIGANRWVHSGWIRLIEADFASPPALRRGLVIADVLNVRARPGVGPDNPPVDRLLRGAQVHIYEEALVGGAIWYRIGVNRWVHGSWIQLLADDDELQLAICPSPAADAVQPALPVGWVVSSSLKVRAQPGVSADNPVVGEVFHNQALNILETRTVAGQRWYRIGPDRWVLGSNVGVARFRARPSAIKAGELWVGVNLREQTVVAYEGDQPVYAALAATGMSRTPTVQGIFRTWWRLVSRKMSGGSAATGGYYYLEEVPWTLYFYSGYALHAAYWHDAFGRPRSHGCVNLSPYDAWWIFKWSEAGGPKSPAVYVYWE